MEAVIGSQGQQAMTMGQTKLRGYSRKRTEHFRTKKYPFDAALLRMTEDAAQLRRQLSALHDDLRARGYNPLQAIRELAGLLVACRGL